MASQTTRDREEIRRWAEERGACPAIVSRTGGLLRFEFDPAHASELTEVDWEEFFAAFDRKGLELVYDDKPGSRFHKIVYPETVAPKPRRQPVRGAATRRRPERQRASVAGRRSPAAATNGSAQNSAAEPQTARAGARMNVLRPGGKAAAGRGASRAQAGAKTTRRPSNRPAA